MENQSLEVRPLGEELSLMRELTAEEISVVSGGATKSCTAKITYDNGGDGEAGCTIDW
jgi:hypothetical protein